MRTVKRALDWLARIPVWVAGAMFGVGTVLATAHLLIIATLFDEGRAEWPQWVGRLTVMWYWVLLPLAVLALWSRRRHSEGRLGYIGAVMASIGILQYIVVTLATVVWDGVFSRGELPLWIMWSEVLLLVEILGIVVLSVAMLRDRGVPRIWPILLLLGLVARALNLTPYVMAAVFLLLAGLLIAGRPVPKNRSVLDSQPVQLTH